MMLVRLYGEHPAAEHPVAAFGRAMEGVERFSYGDARAPGVAYAATGVAVGYGTSVVLPLALVVAYTAAGRELRRTAAGVRNALMVGDLDHARDRVTALVGRDPRALDCSGLAAAVIESLAENTVDAAVAPPRWALVAAA